MTLAKTCQDQKKSDTKHRPPNWGAFSLENSPVDRGMQSNEYGMPEYIAWFMLSNFCMLECTVYSITQFLENMEFQSSRSDYCIDCIRHVYRIWNSPQNISTRDGNDSQIPKQARTPVRDWTLPKKKKRDWHWQKFNNKQQSSHQLSEIPWNTMKYHEIAKKN